MSVLPFVVGKYGRNTDEPQIGWSDYALGVTSRAVAPALGMAALNITHSVLPKRVMHHPAALLASVAVSGLVQYSYNRVVRQTVTQHYADQRRQSLMQQMQQVNRAIQTLTPIAFKHPDHFSQLIQAARQQTQITHHLKTVDDLATRKTNVTLGYPWMDGVGVIATIGFGVPSVMYYTGMTNLYGRFARSQLAWGAFNAFVSAGFSLAYPVLHTINKTGEKQPDWMGVALRTGLAASLGFAAQYWNMKVRGSVFKMSLNDIAANRYFNRFNPIFQLQHAALNYLKQGTSGVQSTALQNLIHAAAQRIAPRNSLDEVLSLTQHVRRAKIGSWHPSPLVAKRLQRQIDLRWDTPFWQQHPNLKEGVHIGIRAAGSSTLGLLRDPMMAFYDFGVIGYANRTTALASVIQPLTNLPMQLARSVSLQLSENVLKNRVVK